MQQYKLQQWWKSIQQELHQITQVTHIYKEGNIIVDTLVNVAIDRDKDKVIRVWSNLPTEVKGILRLKQGGMPYLRPRRPK